MATNPTILTAITGGGTSNVTTHTESITLASGKNRVLIAIARHWDSDDTRFQTCHLDPTSLNKAFTYVGYASGNDGSHYYNTRVFVLYETDIPTSGAYDCKVVANSECGRMSLHMILIQDAQQSLLANGGSQDAGTTSRSVALTVEADAFMFMASNWDAAGATMTWGSGQTEIQDESQTDFRIGASWEIATGASDTQVATCTTSGRCSVYAVAFSYEELTLISGHIGIPMTPVLMI